MKKQITIGIIFELFFIGRSVINANDFQTVKKQLQTLLKNEAVILDVRTVEEFKIGSNPKSINLPLDKIETNKTSHGNNIFSKRLRVNAIYGEYGVMNSSSSFIKLKMCSNYNFGLMAGYTWQPSSAQGKLVSTRLKTYSNTIDGSGQYFSTIDFGICYFIIPALMIDYEISFGEQKHYTQYLDRRFNGDHYYLIDKNDSIFGTGWGITYTPFEWNGSSGVHNSYTDKSGYSLGISARQNRISGTGYSVVFGFKFN